jgi:dihydrofolate reductase
MGRILVHEFITADGIIDTPTWTADYPFDPKMGEAIGAIVESSEGILLGRRTFEMFAASWPGRTAEDDPGAPFFNESPKYVISATLQNPEWSNSTVVGPYDAGAIRALKDRLEGDLYVSGSITLVRAMLDDNLVDELHLFVYPVALRGGERLFADGSPIKFNLARNEAYDSGVVHLAYAPSG